MVFRVFVEKKDEFISGEAKTVLFDANTLLGIKGLEKVEYSIDMMQKTLVKNFLNMQKIQCFQNHN